MRFRPQALFGLFVLLLALWALASTRDWPIKTALYPRVIAVPLILLAAVEFALSLRDEDANDAGQAVDFALTASVSPDLVARRTGMIFAWLGGFFLAVVLLGFPRAIPLFVFAYLKGQGRESWMLSLVLAALAWLGFYLLFIRLLHLPFADGLLWQLLTR